MVCSNNNSSLESGFSTVVDQYFKGSVIDQGCSSSHLLAYFANSGCETTLSRIIQRVKAVKELLDHSGTGFESLFSISNFKESVTERKLSLLHVMVIKGRYELAKQLLESGLVDIDAQDCRGWTALHFAVATCNDQMMKLLQKVGANQKLQNDLGGTAQNIWEMIHAPHKDPKEYTIYHEKLGVIEKIDGVAFRELTGANYSDEVLTDPKFFAKDWSSLTTTIPKVSQFQKKIAKQYESFSSSPSKVYMTQHNRTDLGKEITDIGFGVYAREDIEPCEIVVEYIGEEIDEQQQKASRSDYRMIDVDADSTRKVRNPGSLIGDGLPNCVCIPIWADGRMRRVFVSQEKIAKGDPLLIDYHTHWVKASGHRELRPSALREHFQSESIEDMIRKTGKPQLSSACDIYDHPQFDTIGRFWYLLTTPSAFLDLVLRKIITVDDVTLVIENQDPKKQLLTSEILYQNGFLKFVKSYLGKERNPHFDTVFLDLIEEGEIQSVLQVICNFDRMGKLVSGNKMNMSTCSYKDFKGTITKIIETEIKPTLQKFIDSYYC